MRREDQQDATIRCLLLTSVSTCFGHHYAHLQENKGPVTAFGVVFWFCWMWLVGVVGALSCRIRAAYAHLQENKGPVTAFGVLFWFCWMWLVTVVGALSCRIRAVPSSHEGRVRISLLRFALWICQVYNKAASKNVCGNHKVIWPPLILRWRLTATAVLSLNPRK